MEVDMGGAPQNARKSLLSKADTTNLAGHHRTRFQHIRDLMPERDRLASNLFLIAPIRSDEDRAVLRDTVGLYRQETEVAFRPGLEPEKCRCPAVRKRKVDRPVNPHPASRGFMHTRAEANLELRTVNRPAQRWNHIYDCYKKRLIVEQGFAELCFFCNKVDHQCKAMVFHCQTHLDNPEMIPIQCNPFNYGGCLASPGHCPFCLFDPTLPVTIPFHRFPDRGMWKEHIHEHNGNLGHNNTPKCPSQRPQCAEAFESEQELKFHLQDVHCFELMKGFKRLNLEDEADVKPSEVKKARANHHGPDMKTDPSSNQELKFVDETAKLWNQDTSEIKRFFDELECFDPNTGLDDR
jgi:hypothetical protein